MAWTNEKESISNWAEWASTEQNWIAREVNNKRETLKDNLKEEKTIDKGLIRAFETLYWNNRDKLVKVLKSLWYYNGNTDKIREAINALVAPDKLPEKMTINHEFLTKDLSKKVQKAIKAHEAMKEEPHLYKVWEHQFWEDRINIPFKNKDGSFSINGNKLPRLSIGDYLVSNGTIWWKQCYFRAIITDIEYDGNPRDFFTGTVVAVNLCNEDWSDID